MNTQVIWGTAFDEILSFDCGTCAVNVCLASVIHKGDVPQYQRLHMSDSLADSFSTIVKQVLQQQRRKLDTGDLILRQYDAGSKPNPYEVEYLHFSDHDYLKNQLSALDALLDLATFKQESSFIDGLRFYIIVVQPQNGAPLYCFRSYSPKQEITRSRLTVAAIFQDDNYFDRVETPVFIFDGDIDCITREGRVFILNQGNFHKIFQFLEYAQKVAEETLQAIRITIPIQNFDAFADSCRSHPLKLSKLRNIMNKPYFVDGRLTMLKIKETIAKHGLSISIIDVGGQEMLVYDSKQQWAILTLLDDAYLESNMTGNKYETTGKRQENSTRRN